MLNSLRTIGFSFILSASLVGNAMAGIILHGVVRDENKSSPSIYYGSGHGENAKQFPRNYYQYRLHAYDLKYDDKVPLKDRRYNLSAYPPDYNASILARLDLISADEKHNLYKFKLSLKQDSLDYMGEKFKKLWEVGGTLFDADIKFNDGTPAVFFVEVSLSQDEHDHPMFINSKNNKYFDLRILTFDLGIDLIRKADFPVMMIESSKKEL